MGRAVGGVAVQVQMELDQSQLAELLIQVAVVVVVIKLLQQAQVVQELLLLAIFLLHKKRMAAQWLYQVDIFITLLNRQVIL